MWWCCGKRGKDQPGCRFSKHESKDDEDEDEECKPNSLNFRAYHSLNKLMTIRDQIFLTANRRPRTGCPTNLRISSGGVRGFTMQ